MKTTTIAQSWADTPVWFRGRFAKAFTVRGIVEAIDETRDEPFGIRLENGNFVWTRAEQVIAREERSKR